MLGRRTPRHTTVAFSPHKACQTGWMEERLQRAPKPAASSSLQQGQLQTRCASKPSDQGSLIGAPHIGFYLLIWLTVIVSEMCRQRLNRCVTHIESCNSNALCGFTVTQSYTHFLFILVHPAVTSGCLCWWKELKKTNTELGWKNKILFNKSWTMSMQFISLQWRQYESM